MSELEILIIVLLAILIWSVLMGVIFAKWVSGEFYLRERWEARQRRKHGEYPDEG